jgi:hypothetical protein
VVEGACLLGGEAFLPALGEDHAALLDYPKEDQNLGEASGVEVLDLEVPRNDQEFLGVGVAEMVGLVVGGEEALAVDHCQMEEVASCSHWGLRDPRSHSLEVGLLGAQHLQQEALLAKEAH